MASKADLPPHMPLVLLLLLLLSHAPCLQLARNIIEGVEKLDRQLRGQETTETIADGLKQLQQQLQQLVDDAQPPP